MTIREESIGGTPANRMIHRESHHLLIGPYAIDQERNVRAIPYSKMFGRPTGNARHLTDPARKIYYATKTAGISPRSSYLKVVGDFARWGDHVVLGCDDTAKSEFLNKHRAKGKVAAPQSQSNLWFVKPDQLDHFGPVIGRGAVWLSDKIEANTPSDPYPMTGYDKKSLTLTSSNPTKITFEIDITGHGDWMTYRPVAVSSPFSHQFPASVQAYWLRVTSSKNTVATAQLSYE
jgi:hypothetical protein